MLTPTLYVLLYTFAFLVAIGITRYAVAYNAKIPVDIARGHAKGKWFFLVVLPIPCMMFLGVSMLLVSTGVPLAWTLGSLALAFVSAGTGVGMLNTKMVKTYENGWGVMAYFSLPAWIVGGAVVGLVRIWL